MNLQVTFNVPINNEQEGRELETALTDGDVDFNDLPSDYMAIVEYRIVID